jgi:hypothetical protein
MRKTIGLAALLALLGGCATGASPRWHQEGASETQLERDQSDCMGRATAVEDPSSLSPGDRARIERAFEDCMQARGWSRQR